MSLTLYRQSFRLSTFKAFSDDVTEKLKFVLGRVENRVGKGKNAG